MAKIIEEIILKVSTDTRGVDLGMSKIQKKIAPVEKGVTKLRESVKGMKTEMKSASKETGILSSSMGKLASGAAAGLVIAKLKEMGSEAIKVSRDFERIGLSMNTVFGGDAGKQMAFIEAEAERLGVSVRESARGFTQLAASTKSVLTLKQTKELFTATAEAATALGLDAQRTGSILRALSQIASKGTLSAEELRQQIGEHLPGAFDLAAKSMGVTTSELNKMLEQGMIPAADFLPKFAAELKNTYHEGAMKNANSEIANNTRNLNLWEKQLKLSGGTLKGFTTPAIGAALNLWDMTTDVIADGIVAIGGYTNTLDSMAGATVKATTVTTKFVEELPKIATAAEKAKKALTSSLDIITNFHRDLFNAGEDDKLRVSLGLTEKGFSKIAVVVKALGNSGLDADGKLERLRNTLELMKESGDIKKGDFIKSEDVKKAEAIQKSMEKWVGDEFLLPKGWETFGKVLEGDGPEAPDLSAALTQQEGLELGTTEAAKFLIRPVKDQNDIAKQQLVEEKRIAAATELMANDKTILKVVR